jgi:hypothetical protein
MSLAAAEARVLDPRVIGRSSFDKYTVDVLRSLCNKLELQVACTGLRGKPIKRDYIAALHDFVSISVVERTGLIRLRGKEPSP